MADVKVNPKYLLSEVTHMPDNSLIEIGKVLKDFYDAMRIGGFSQPESMQLTLGYMAELVRKAAADGEKAQGKTDS